MILYFNLFFCFALSSHKQCVQLVKQMGDRLQEAREIGNVGAVYLGENGIEFILSKIDLLVFFLQIYSDGRIRFGC